MHLLYLVVQLRIHLRAFSRTAPSHLRPIKAGIQFYSFSLTATVTTEGKVRHTLVLPSTRGYNCNSHLSCDLNPQNQEGEPSFCHVSPRRRDPVLGCRPPVEKPCFISSLIFSLKIFPGMCVKRVRPAFLPSLRSARPHPAGVRGAEGADCESA